MPFTFDTQEQAEARDLQAVDAGLDEYNLAEPAIHQVRQLSVFARDELGQVKGGAVGRTWGQCCELQQLWVAEERRGQGIGAALMERFELEASHRGCTLAYLETFSFQAHPFYERNGYSVALKTKGFTQGVVKYTMQKVLGKG